MLSDKLSLILNHYDKVIAPSVEAGCDRVTRVASKILRRQLSDLIRDLGAWERNGGPVADTRRGDAP